MYKTKNKLAGQVVGFIIFCVFIGSAIYIYSNYKSIPKPEIPIQQKEVAYKAIVPHVVMRHQVIHFKMYAADGYYVIVGEFEYLKIKCGDNYVGKWRKLNE